MNQRKKIINYFSKLGSNISLKASNLCKGASFWSLKVLSAENKNERSKSCFIMKEARCNNLAIMKDTNLNTLFHRLLNVGV